GGAALLSLRVSTDPARPDVRIARWARRRRWWERVRAAWRLRPGHSAVRSAGLAAAVRHRPGGRQRLGADSAAVRAAGPGWLRRSAAGLPRTWTVQCVRWPGWRSRWAGRSRSGRPGWTARTDG